MKQVLGFIQTTRLIKSLAVGLLLTIVSSSVHYGLGALIFLAFSFVFNDWVDAPKDKISHPCRAIPSKKITHRQAFYIAIVLLILGSGWTIIFLKEYIFGFLIVYSFSVIYSLILKPNIPVLATPVWSVTIAILFLQSFTTETSAYM